MTLRLVLCLLVLAQQHLCVHAVVIDCRAESFIQLCCQSRGRGPERSSFDVPVEAHPPNLQRHGTLGYFDPSINGDDFESLCLNDIFAFGVIALACFAREEPFVGIHPDFFFHFECTLIISMNH